MKVFTRLVTRFLRPRGISLDRLRRFARADLERSSGSFSWTAAELRMMAQTEKLASVSRRVIRTDSAHSLPARNGVAS